MPRSLEKFRVVQQTQLMLMISLSLYMGDGTGVLFDRFLHLQGRKKDPPPRRKRNIRDREGH